MEDLAISARDAINEEFDAGLSLLIAWKALQYRKRGIIENLGSHAELHEALGEEAELRNGIQRWADEL